MARLDLCRSATAFVRNEPRKPDAFAQDAGRTRAPQGGMLADMKPVRVLVVGAAGRMGKTVLHLAEEDPAIDIVARCDLGDPIEPGMKNCDVAIDFSHPDAIGEICRAALDQRKALVIGTTGHSEEQRRIIERASQSVAIVFASNFSAGVNVLFWLTQKAAALLGADFNAEIIETHHKMKKDAPSGTAKTPNSHSIHSRRRSRGRTSRHFHRTR